MNVLTCQRKGTPITVEEREYLLKELALLKTAKEPEKVAASIKSMVELVGDWDAELEFMCIDHDTAMIEKVLETGIVQ